MTDFQLFLNRDMCHTWDRKGSLFPEHLISLTLIWLLCFWLVLFVIGVTLAVQLYKNPQKGFNVQIYYPKSFVNNYGTSTLAHI